MCRELYPGFRFSPTEEELLEFYLKNKLEHKRERDIEAVIPVLDIYGFDPWQLPRNQSEDQQWFFFCPRQEREAQGGRATRTTPSGYWKAVGSLSFVYSSSNIMQGTRAIGVKKTMVFYMGKAHSGTKTKWKMNEYRAIDHQVDQEASLPNNIGPTPHRLINDLTLCRVYWGTVRSVDRRPSMVMTDNSSEATMPASTLDPLIINNVTQEAATTSTLHENPSSSAINNDITDNTIGQNRTEQHGGEEEDDDDDDDVFDWNSMLDIDSMLLEWDWN